MKKKVPFVPLSLEKAKKVARHYIGWGETFSKMFPSLSLHLEQTDLGFEPREWVAVAFYSFVMYTLVLFAGVFILSTVIHVALLKSILISFLTGFALGGGVFLYIVFYPKFMAGRKIKELEHNLPYALHHLLIHVRSGVPLFNSLVSIARGGYGSLSDEFGKAVTEINTGKSEIASLEILARNNPSLYFRRVLWQIVNALKSGADIGVTLKEIVDSLATEQRIAIKKYGSELNPLALFYMILVVIFPTLGIIFILVLFSFIGTTFNIKIIMLGILGFLVIFQFMFIGLIKAKRPVGVY